MLSPGLLTHWTREAVDAAAAENDRLVSNVVGRIIARADALDLLAVCRVVADGASRALLALHGPLDESQGEVWVLTDIGDAEEQPSLLFAARVVTAYANGDSDIVAALVAAAVRASPIERAESLRSLVIYAAGLRAQAARQMQDPTEGLDDD